MIIINLLPWREKRKIVLIKLYGILLAFIILLSFTSTFMTGLFMKQKVKNADEMLVKINAELSSLNNSIGDWEEAKGKYEKIEEQIEIARSLEREKNKPLQVINALVESIPKGMVLDKVIYNKSTMVIKGQSNSNSQVAELMNVFKKSTLFFKPELNETINKKSKDNMIDFEINVQVASHEIKGKNQGNGNQS